MDRRGYWVRRSLGVVIAALGLVTFAGMARAASVSVDVALDHGTLLAGEKQTAYLRVALTGGAVSGVPYRAPLNVALVIDRSGSMAGYKIEQAKQAALAALERMGPDDIVSVVAYDTTVTVLVPATKVSDRASIVRGIRKLRAGGSTALFAGTVKGAQEVRKFLSRDRVNRVVLMSDGLANVGPDRPSDLAELGTSLRAEGIGVTTVGLGVDYNEDLMVSLARASGAAFTFVEDARDLDRLYAHGFGGLQSIVATDVSVVIRFAEGFRPVRCLGRTCDIVGDRVALPMAQLYSGGAEELLIEFETPAFSASSQAVAEVDVRYHWLPSDDDQRCSANATAEFSDSAKDVAGSANPTVKVAVVQRLADEQALMAMRLRDQGRLDAARRELEAAERKVDAAARLYRSERLKKQTTDLREDRESLRDEGKYKRQRKTMQRRSMRQFDEEFF